MAASSVVRCGRITRHLTPCRTKHLQRWKWTNTSVHRDKERETKKGTRRWEGQHSEDDYEGNDEPAESRSSSFPTSPQSREQYTMCFVFHTKTKISAVSTLLMLKIRVCILLLPFWGWLKRHRTKVCLCLCLKLFDHLDLKQLATPSHSVSSLLRQLLVWGTEVLSTLSHVHGQHIFPSVTSSLSIWIHNKSFTCNKKWIICRYSCLPPPSRWVERVLKNYVDIVLIHRGSTQNIWLSLITLFSWNDI